MLRSDRLLAYLTASLALMPMQASVLHAQIIEGLPDAIVCSVKDPTGILAWEQLVYYVSARMVDGRTLYKTLTSDPVVLMVGPDGKVDGANLADCDGRTVASLREEGRAFQLTGPSPQEQDS
ncbi:MAG: hypothetical protein V2I82_01475 [Halieaceae bacterium]|jgi:hypothetical protein|nr:hypothetical protein [Halieaceae bacterium]